MFEMHDSIHVLYGSNDVAAWTIAASLLTFAASLIVGVAAYKNGRAATRIAKEASDREERYRLQQRVEKAQQKLDEARHDAASQMMAAVWALAEAKHTYGLDRTSKRAVATYSAAKSVFLSAMTEIELLPANEHPRDLAPWFANAMNQFDDRGTHKALNNSIRASITSVVRKWHDGEITASQLARTIIST